MGKVKTLTKDDFGFAWSPRATIYNGIAYLSGSCSIDPYSGDLVKGDIAAEADITLNNLKLVIEKIGADADDILHFTVYLADIKDREIFIDVFSRHFKTNPAKTIVAVKDLWSGIRTEVSCEVAI